MNLNSLAETFASLVSLAAGILEPVQPLPSAQEPIALDKRSPKNLHDFPRSGWWQWCGGNCRRCGDPFVEAPYRWSTVYECTTRLREGYGGCVALPAPAVPMTPRDLPVVCEMSETR
jgi:hypothetical protein